MNENILVDLRQLTPTEQKTLGVIGSPAFHKVTVAPSVAAKYDLIGKSELLFVPDVKDWSAEEEESGLVFWVAWNDNEHGIPHLKECKVDIYALADLLVLKKLLPYFEEEKDGTVTVGEYRYDNFRSFWFAFTQGEREGMDAAVNAILLHTIYPETKKETKEELQRA